MTTDDDGKTSGRNERLRGQMGVNTRALKDGCTIGPPAEREYAVEPVGVETIRPSDLLRVLLTLAHLKAKGTYHRLRKMLAIHKYIDGIQVRT